MSQKIFYLTKEKLRDLQREFDELIAFERTKVIGEEAPKMLESEDMSTEFMAYNEDMNTLRARIDELKNILDNYELIKAPPKEKAQFVDLGARVRLDIGGKHDEFTIVGTLEADPNLGRISNESPVGKALIGRKVGDEVLVTAPVKKVYKIKDISYEVN